MSELKPYFIRYTKEFSETEEMVKGKGHRSGCGIIAGTTAEEAVQELCSRLGMTQFEKISDLSKTMGGRKEESEYKAWSEESLKREEMYLIKVRA